MESLKLSDVDPIWNKIYNTIANLNSLLACIDDKQNVFGGDDYAVFKGEALGLPGRSCTSTSCAFLAKRVR